MRSVNIQGVNISITDNMLDKVSAALKKISNRYPSIHHNVTVKEVPSGFEIKMTYQDQATSVKASVKTKDFYKGIVELRNNILSQLEKEHKIIVQKKRGVKPTSSQPIELVEPLEEYSENVDGTI